VLLDLYCATDDIGLRWSIADRLTEISHLAAVPAQDIRADLEAIIAIAEGYGAIALDWADHSVDEELVARAACCSVVTEPSGLSARLRRWLGFPSSIPMIPMPIPRPARYCCGCARGPAVTSTCCERSPTIPTSWSRFSTSARSRRRPRTSDRTNASWPT
jgi:hypothetical protein